MDHLWTPWRYRYIANAGSSDTCIFCVKAGENKDAENYILYRGKLNFVLLNLYPYTNGHLMIAPYRHVATLEDASQDALAEMMRLTRRAEVNLRIVYRPHGLNIGMNIGASAGAGVAGHIHMHVVPRWASDANFMTTIGETRILPEELPATYQKLSKMDWDEDQGKKQKAKGKRQM
jgi:ATP adenylyltransferase